MPGIQNKTTSYNSFMKKIYLSLLCGLMLGTSCNRTDANKDSAKKENVESAAEESPIAKDTSWKSLSLREKIGQTMMVVALTEDHKAAGNGSIKGFLEKYPVGSLFIADWYLKEKYTPKDPLEVLPEILKEYNEYSKVPMLVCEDFERGIGETYSKYTHLPVGMSLGAAADTALAYDSEQAIAMEAREMGFNWLLHPVSDLNMNPLQELVVERSVSDDVDKALPILKSQINGLHSKKIISTVKHFPGDGVTMRNQHIVTTANSLSKDEWMNSFGKLFKGLIDGGAASIMVGHIQLPAFQTQKINGQLPPATLSKELMVDMLKNEFNYKGVIITDALNMGGCAGYYKNELEVSVQCFAAGADVVLWPSLAYMDTVEARILRGEIPMERLDDAVERVWAMRERFGYNKKENHEIATPMTDADKAFVKKTGAAVADKAITVVENSDSLLPIKAENGKRIALIEIGEQMTVEKFAVTKRELESRGFSVDILENPHFYAWGYRIDSLNNYDKILVCFENRYFHPLGTCLLKNKESFGVWTANMLDPKKKIAISYANPYSLEIYEGIVPTKINAYSIDTFTQKAVVKVLTGELEATATSPVKLNNPMLK